MLSRADLHSYQEQAAQFITERQQCALWLGLGLGKSVSTLTAITDLLDGIMVNRVLIVAPLRVSNSVWKQEAKAWSHTRHLSVTVATGPENRRRQVIESNADVTVINRENVVWLVKQYGKRWPFDMLVVDESTSFKSPTAKRWRALKKMAPHMPYRVLLTGTPSPNGLLDLWAQQYLVDLGEALGRTYTGYKQRWFESDHMGYNWTPRDGADEAIHERVAPRVLSMQSGDYLQMPDRVDVTEHVQIPDKALQSYRQFERDLLIEVDEHELEAVSAAALANKLLQWANGAVYHGDQHEWVETHRAKLDVLTDLRDDNPADPLLVAYAYQSDRQRLIERFPDATVLDTDPDTINRWNRGEIPMLLCHPASAGHGLNLQSGGSVVVWFGIPWSLELYQQLNARLHRQGQQRTVRVVHIVADNTIDARVMNVLAGKHDVQQALIEAVRDYR